MARRRRGCSYGPRRKGKCPSRRSHLGGHRRRRRRRR